MLLSFWCICLTLFSFLFVGVCFCVSVCDCVCMCGVYVQSHVYEYMYLWTHENQNITLCLNLWGRFSLSTWSLAGTQQAPPVIVSTPLVALSFFHEFWRFKLIHLYAHNKSSNLLSHLLSLLVLWMDFCYVTQACLKFVDLNFFLPLTLRSLHLKNSIV